MTILVQIALRCLVAYVFLLVLLRSSGKRTVRQADAFDFVLALTIGDLVDDAIWNEVPIAQFFVAAATLVIVNLFITTVRARHDLATRETRS
jgi:uncharacterized membrane protein YcaP (DUF421 family)